MLPISMFALASQSSDLLDFSSLYAIYINNQQSNINAVLDLLVIIGYFSYPIARYYFDTKRKNQRSAPYRILSESIATPIKSKCFYCGYKIPENITNCPRCGRPRMRCSVCNKDIIPGDLLVKCPHCGALSHKDHLAEAELIMEKGSCPKCGEKLEEIKIATPKSKCLFCGRKIPVDADFCPHCGESRARCSLCQEDITQRDTYIKCPYCGVLSHRDHLLEWIKVKGYCPNCKQRLKEEDIS